MPSDPPHPGLLKALVPLLLLSLAACAPQPSSAQSFTYPDAFPGVSFVYPVDMVHTPSQGDRVYVVEQGGAGGRSRIQTLTLGASRAATFIDLDARVAAGGEMGLLGLAFHPDYASNGKFYVDYTASNPRRTVISEFTRLVSNPLQGDPDSERILLEISQPASNHNGGKVAFGPDGFLYVSLGDGGDQGDPNNLAQNRSVLLGKILRIDVDQTSGNLEYAIPGDNPFVGNGSGFREEIFAYGLRNPWRFTFDSETGDLWVGDVGQGSWEEVNVVTNGGNYGWRQMEGFGCYVSGCNPAAYIDPVHAYDHSSSGGYSITGGFVYRGSAAPALAGKYLFGDFVSAKLWMMDAIERPAAVDFLTGTVSQISAIVEGPDQEAYLVTYSGTIRKVAQSGVASAPEAEIGEARPRLVLAGPQPFRESTTLVATVPSAARVRATLLDSIGRHVADLFDGDGALGTNVYIRIDGRHLVPGLYFVRLVTSDGESVVKRIVRTG